MTTHTPKTEYSPATALARQADSEMSLSLVEILTLFFRHAKTFFICLVLTPLLALLFTFLIPATYEGTAKVLIRYSSTESAFLGDLIPQGRALISGQSNAEIMKSLPALARVVQQENITGDDIAQRPFNVLAGYIFALLPDFNDDEEGGDKLADEMPGIDPQTLALAKDFQESVEVETLKNASRTFTGSGDELIELTTKSPNPKKIAEMTNGLARAFIDEYYSLSLQEARRAADYLRTKVEEAANYIAQARNSGGKGNDDLVPFQSGMIVSSGRDNNRLGTDSPLLGSTSGEIAAAEIQLARLQQIYRADSREVKEQKERLEELKSLYITQEQLETAKLSLEQLKVKYRQAILTEELYKNRLIPISIIEPAVAPQKIFTKNVVRYVINVGVGAVLGFFLGTGLIVVFAALDQRIHTTWGMDRLRRESLDVLGSIRRNSTLEKSGLKRLPLEKLPPVELELDFLQAIYGLDVRRMAKGSLITVTGVGEGEGKSSVALQMACALARDRRKKILLIDGNFQHPFLSQHFAMTDMAGITEFLLGNTKIVKPAYATRLANLGFIPTGNLHNRSGLGFFRGSLAQMLAEIKHNYDFTIVDTSGISSGATESLLFSTASDGVILVVEAGRTRKYPLCNALNRLQDAGVPHVGVILNKRVDIIPSFIYKRL